MDATPPRPASCVPTAFPQPAHLSAGGDASAPTMRSDAGHYTRLRAMLDELRNDVQRAWTAEEFVAYHRDWRRLAPSTVQGYLRDLRRMGAHPVAPVALEGTKEDLVHSALVYLAHREHVEGAGAAAIGNDHRALRALGRLLGIPADVWPPRPTQPRHDDRWLPSPADVHGALTASYGPRRSYTANLIRYWLAYGFGLGVRSPSELHAMRVHDLDLDARTLVVREPKKGHRRRTLYVEPDWLLDGGNVASLGNWLAWRDKCQPETDAMFPRWDGQEWSNPTAMRAWIAPRIQAEASWYHPYLARHWCATVRLIESAWNWESTADWLGHDKTDLLRQTYARGSKIYAASHGTTGLLQRGFSKPRGPVTPAETASPVRAPPGRNDGTARSCPSDQKEREPVTPIEHRSPVHGTELHTAHHGPPQSWRATTSLGVAA